MSFVKALAGMRQNRASSFCTCWTASALSSTSFASPTRDVEVMGELLLKSGGRKVRLCDNCAL